MVMTTITLVIMVMVMMTLTLVIRVTVMWTMTVMTLKAIALKLFLWSPKETHYTLCVRAAAS